MAGETNGASPATRLPAFGNADSSRTRKRGGGNRDMHHTTRLVLMAWFLGAGFATERPAQTRPQATAAHTLQADTVRTGLLVGYDSLRAHYQTLRPRRNARHNETPDAEDPPLALDGLVVDETLTKLGRDFYDLFYARWRPPDGALNYTIAVQERPAPGLGSVILVQLNDEIVFQARLQPRYEFAEQAARQAVTQVRRYFHNEPRRRPAY